MERGHNGVGCKDSDIVYGDNKHPNVFTADVTNPRCRRVRDDAGDVASFSDVALLDLEAEMRVFASDRRRQFIEALERVVGNFQVDGRKVQFVGIDGLATF